MKPKIAVYPGSYDPVTNGHVDIIERGLKIFDKLVVAVLNNSAKNYLFHLNERMEILKETFMGNDRIEIDSFDGLLVDYLNKKNISVVVRGLRAISDFDMEFQMGLMNRKLKPDIEVIFFMPSICYSFLSSSMVKEIYQLGGEIKSMVPEIVAKELKKKFR